ncbi:MAG: NlpC/P60 family protein [Nanoarchaeota archaeon]
MMTEEIKESIKNHAFQEKPKECCGLIVQSDNYKAFPCRNRSEDPIETFSIDTSDYLKALNIGKIIAFYHSHVETPNFSEFDKLNSEKHNLPSVLYCINKNIFNYYSPHGYEMPYENREYVLGNVDCVTLIIDYYKRELNIDLPDLTSKYRYIENKHELPEAKTLIKDLIDYCKKNDFIEIENLKKNDILLCKTSLIVSPVHACIYLGQNQILHHPWKRKSCIEIYKQYWKYRTLHKLRHKLLI